MKKIPLLILILVVFNMNAPVMENSLENDVPPYKTISSVKYKIESNFTLQHGNLKNYSYKLQNSIIDYQESKCEISDIEIPYQVNLVKSNKIEGPRVNTWIETDKFGNKFNIREVNLSRGEAVSISEMYEIKLNRIELDCDFDINLEAYAKNDKIYDLYCNNKDTFYQGWSSELIQLSNTIIENETNPIIMTQKIMSWISENIAYGKKNRTALHYRYYGDYGAIETYLTKKGVCKDYAELMVTLLRIQNIPARIVKGFVLDKDKPVKGDIFEFHTYWKNESFEGNNLGFHSWIEYYVPNLGWLPCDPTWSDFGLTYFNSLDCVHFRIASGSWFSMPMFTYTESDHILLNPLKYIPINSCSYSFTIKITVLKSDFERYRIQIEYSVIILMILFVGSTILNLKSIKKLDFSFKCFLNYDIIKSNNYNNT